MTLRLFVAAVPPQGVRDRLDAFLEPRRDHARDLRWTLPESWHLTCAFLASVPDPLVPALCENLTEVASRTTGFEVTIAGSGAFPNPDRAKAFWLGVREGAEPLAQLASRTRTAAARCGIAVEGGQFRGHLTLARANGISGTGWLEVFDAIEPLRWQVTEISLMGSRSLPGGAGYRSLATFDLTG